MDTTELVLSLAGIGVGFGGIYTSMTQSPSFINILDALLRRGDADTQEPTVVNIVHIFLAGLIFLTSILLFNFGLVGLLSMILRAWEAAHPVIAAAVLIAELNVVAVAGALAYFRKTFEALLVLGISGLAATYFFIAALAVPGL